MKISFFRTEGDRLYKNFRGFVYIFKFKLFEWDNKFNGGDECIYITEFVGI